MPTSISLPNFFYMRKLTTDDFIERARKVHGDKYIYDEVDMNNRDEKGRIPIICPIHGKFWQAPNDHLKGKGCKKCHFEKLSKIKSKSKEQFEKEARAIHGDKYDYSKVVYINSGTKVCIICPTHGEFWMAPANHIYGNKQGCPKCRIEKIKKALTMSFDEFYDKAIKVHGVKFVYDEDTYSHTKEKMRIFCPRHGEFWQRPNDHLMGRGCPFCRESSMERDVSLFLKRNNRNFIKQCRKDNLDWLGRQSLDFYIPSFKIAIECQGEQHYKEKKIWDKEGRNSLEHRIELDERKLTLCEEHGVKLLYFAKEKYNNSIITDKEKLLEIIESQHFS